MIKGHSINLLQLFDVPQKFKVMSLIVETIKRTTADQKRSCGYAPHIQMLITYKMGTDTYLLDKEHLPLRPEFEDNTIVMNAEDPTSVEAQEKREKAKAEKATKMPSAEEAAQVFLKSKQDQLRYLIQATLRIEKGLATLTQNQESLERIIETKFYDLVSRKRTRNVGLGASSNSTAESKYDLLVSSMTIIAHNSLCSTRAYNIYA